MIDPVENHIMVNPSGSPHVEAWQAIGYYKGQHVSSFGKTPADALQKALSEYQPEEEDAFE